MNWIKLKDGSYANLDQVVHVGAPGPGGCRIEGGGHVLGFADPGVVLPRVDVHEKQAKMRAMAGEPPLWQRQAGVGATS